MNHVPPQPGGKIFLVGAGPGDPGLITVKGKRCIERADLLLCDGLVSPDLLDKAAPSAEVFCVCRGGASSVSGQVPVDEVAGRLAAAFEQGKTSVYLKSGDPSVFSRVGRELKTLRDRGVRYEIVPGVTAALAAAAHAEIPLTHAEHASAVALVTGHPPSDDKAADLDYAALASFPGTLVFYMGSDSVAEWSDALLAAGKAADTPVAIVHRCSLPDQATYRCDLGTVAETIRRQRIEPPTIIVVGEVVAAAPERSWFARRPLAGRRVLLTRPAEQSEPLARRLAELGAEVLVQPAIRIEPPEDWSAVDAALARLDEFDWLVFSSVNGVRYLIERLWETGNDVRRLGHLKLAAIGPATADELHRYHLSADLVPAEYRAEALAGRLAEIAPRGRFFLARASRGREVLAETLTAAGARVEQVVVYRSSDETQPEPDVADALAAGRLDWATVTSSAIARAMANMFGDDLQRVRLASISPITSGVLRELGFLPEVEAETYTMDGLLSAVLAREGADRVC